MSSAYPLPHLSSSVLLFQFLPHLGKCTGFSLNLWRRECGWWSSNPSWKEVWNLHDNPRQSFLACATSRSSRSPESKTAAKKKLHGSCQGTIFQSYASGRVVFLGSVPGCNVNWSRYFLRYLKWTSFMKSMYIVYSMLGFVCVFVENPSGGILWKPHVGKIGLVFSSILVANRHFMIRPGFLEKPSSPHKGS